MSSMKEIVSSERRLIPLKYGDFIYVHPRSCHSDGSSDKSSYFGRFRGYADGENLLEVDINVDIEFRYEKRIWVPRRTIINGDEIQRVDTVEDDGYLIFVGEEEIKRGMRANRNPNYYLVSDRIEDSFHRSIHGSAHRSIQGSRGR